MQKPHNESSYLERKGCQASIWNGHIKTFRRISAQPIHPSPLHTLLLTARPSRVSLQPHNNKSHLCIFSKVGAIRVWSLSDRIASRCYWSRSRDRAPVYPTHISLLCAPDGVNTLDRFKIFEEKDQLKSGGGVEFFSQLSPSKRGSIDPLSPDPLQALATVIENSCSCLLCPVHSIHSGVKVLLRDAS